MRSRGLEIVVFISSKCIYRDSKNQRKFRFYIFSFGAFRERDNKVKDKIDLSENNFFKKIDVFRKSLHDFRENEVKKLFPGKIDKGTFERVGWLGFIGLHMSPKAISGKLLILLNKELVTYYT